MDFSSDIENQMKYFNVLKGKNRIKALRDIYTIKLFSKQRVNAFLNKNIVSRPVLQ